MFANIETMKRFSELYDFGETFSKKIPQFRFFDVFRQSKAFSRPQGASLNFYWISEIYETLLVLRAGGGLRRYRLV